MRHSIASIAVRAVGAAALVGAAVAFVAPTRASAAVTHQTHTALTKSAASPSFYGEKVTLAATVSSPDVSETAIPSETVTFYDDSTALGTAKTTDGVAKLDTTEINAGVQSITATYAGDATFKSSTSSAVSISIDRARTTTTLTPGAPTIPANQPINFTVKVTAVAPGGGVPRLATVTFRRATLVIGTALVTTSGTATFQYTVPSNKDDVTYKFSASVANTSNYIGSKGTTTVEVKGTGVPG